MTGYGNRGMTFESLIEYANRRYRLDKRAIIEKQHREDSQCEVRGKSHSGFYGPVFPHPDSL